MDDRMDFAFNEARKVVRSVLKEFMTQGELDRVENYADDLFNNVGVDVEFTAHFVDRLNDPRNGKDIESIELFDLFKKLYEKYGQKLPTLRKGTNALVNDMNSNINIPFTLVWDANKKEFDMVNKTIMRTKNFYSKDMKLKV